MTNTCKPVIRAYDFGPKMGGVGMGGAGAGAGGTGGAGGALGTGRPGLTGGSRLSPIAARLAVAATWSIQRV
jgi:hypothetical protein